MRIGGIDLNRAIVASIGKDPLDSAFMAKKLGADILEIRIDLLEVDVDKLIKDVKQLGMPIIITNRSNHDGGAWKGPEDDRISGLISVLQLADAVDIELCANDVDIVIKRAKTLGKTVIVSTHDFGKTPDTEVMRGILEESFSVGADIAKLAVMALSFEDVLRLLELTLLSKKPVCTIAMGEKGRHSRVVAPIYGSVMTYGYIGTATAPGQLRVDELKTILDIL
jgi:3-dehydroquinate dehydratase-1